MSLPYTDPILNDTGGPQAVAQTVDGIDNNYDGRIDEGGETGDVNLTWNIVVNDGVTGAPPLPEFTKSITVTVTWQTPLGGQKSLTLNTVRARNATAT